MKWVRAVVVVAFVVALIAGLVAAFTGGSSSDRVTSPTATTDPDTFTFEGDDGSITFGQDGDEATLDFAGDDAAGTFSFDLDGDGVVTEGEGGTFTLADGPPPGWPDDFPLPDGAVPIRGSILAASPIRQLSVTYEVADLPQQVVEFYEVALADDDPIVDVVTADGTYDATISFEGRWVGYLSATPFEGRTLLAVQIVEEQPAHED